MFKDSNQHKTHNLLKFPQASDLPLSIMVSTTLTTTVSQQTTASGSNQTVHHLRPHSSLHYSTTLQSSAIRGSYYLNSDSSYNSGGSESKDTSSSNLYNGHFTNTVRTQHSSSNVIPIPTSSTTSSAIRPRPDILLNSPTSSCTSSNVLRNEVNLLESTSPPLSDQISILFPKCRPKSDANTNPATSTTQQNSSSNNFAQSPPAASGSSYSSESVSSARISTNPFLCLPSPSGNETKRNKFEITSHKDQEVVDMPRKSSGYNQPSSHQQQQQQQQQPYQQQHYHQQQQQQQPNQSTTHRTMKSSGNQNPFINHNYWDTRHNTTPAGTVLNSPELTSENTSRRHGHNYLQKPQHIRLGRSPVSHQNPSHDYYNAAEVNERAEHHEAQNRGDNETYNRAASIAASNGGNGSGVVVFDDISDSWQNLRVTTGSPPASAAPLVESTIDSANHELSKSENEAYKNYKKYLDKNYAINIEMRNGIIEYEGSPRRFGQGIPEDEEVQSQNFKFNAITSSPQKMHPIRPGFPQRIVSTPQDSPPPLLNLKMSPVNNTEDTSNDVSEIGTLSDMTVSEVISEAMMAATSTTAGLCSPGTTAKEDTLVSTSAAAAKSSTFDYLYEFSETRKVLEEFFECPSTDDKPIENGSDVDSIDIQYEFHSNVNREDDDDIALPPQLDHIFSVQSGHMNNKSPSMDENYRPVDDDVEGNDDDDDDDDSESPQPVPVVVANSCSPVKPQQNQHHVVKQQQSNFYNTNGVGGGGGGILDNRRTLTRDNDKLVQYRRDIDFFLESASRSSGDQMDSQDGINHNPVQPRSYRCSPETTDYDSNCGDLDSLSGEFNGVSTYCNYPKCYTTSMPVLEDGLSSGHTSDTENNNRPVQMGGISMLMDPKRNQDNSNHVKSNRASPNVDAFTTINESPVNGQLDNSGRDSVRSKRDQEILGQSPSSSNSKVFQNIDPDLDSLYSISVFHRGADMVHVTPPPPAPAPHRKPTVVSSDMFQKNQIDFKEQIPTTLTGGGASSNLLNRTKSLKSLEKPFACNQPPSIPERLSNASPSSSSPVWVPRYLETSVGKSLLDTSDRQQGKNLSGDEDDVDTDLETDRLLGHQRLDDQGFYDDTKSSSWDRKPISLLATSLSKFSPKVQQQNSKNSNGSLSLRQGFNSLLTSTPEIPPPIPPKTSTTSLLHNAGGGSMSSLDHSDKSPEKTPEAREECAVVTIGSPSADSGSDGSGNGSQKKDTQNSVTGEKKVKKSKNQEVLIEGVLFRARYLGSTQLVCEGQPTKSTRMMQAEEAVSRIKAPDGDVQPSTEVDLFISTEKIMVLNTDLKEIMMDHALRTISYIADIGDLVVLMARRRFVSQDIDDGPKLNRTPKMICHVFESDEAQFIAQSIGQAFQVAYMEFLKANGIEDHSFVKEMDYQEVLNSQEIFGDELEIFAKKELQKEVVVPKAKGEILGVVIVESGWGSMLPTVVIANLMSSGAAARCGQLNIGDQLIAINGLSLVGLPLSTCQTYIKNTKNQTVVKFTVVPCAPVVEVKIKRPNTKYQLGFSVQNGVICSLLRGGIAERGGVRVGHRIIEINNQSVVAVPHEKIVNLLATSVGEILMKTMPTSMFRLLTGQENPIYI
ncbi:uncharacterized protein LOC129909033 isoform X2 [Episyrphus balteatus]|uniref:uncharacterized protein LOC129909033 isoform X2 n=1 Tax=Episyrphus balteatus TaxID=286459 RepID=UPI002486A7FD|nr:uncharacterized protein LOC129909033 isoform X2 [Episyrphus balteatus]